MIWFACKQCGKTHGRPESAVGAMVFCECGQGNTVPWESTVAEPEAAELPAAPAAPRLEPLAFDAEPPPLPPRERRPGRAGPGPGRLAYDAGPEPRRHGRRSFPTPDPNFCLNHQEVAVQAKCAACAEAFCGDCLVTLKGETLCGPCKNLRIRVLQQPPKVSGMALTSMILAGVIIPLGLCLPLATRSVFGLLPLLGHAAALVLGLLGLRETETSNRVAGRSLAITGIFTAVIGVILTVLLALVAARQAG